MLIGIGTKKIGLRSAYFADFATPPDPPLHTPQRREIRIRPARYLKEKLKTQRLHLMYFSSALNVLTGLSKAVTAISVTSPLIGLNAAYSFTLCLARVPYLHYSRTAPSVPPDKIRSETEKTLHIIGSVIILLGILSTVFSVQMLITGESISYNRYSLFTLGFCTLVKLGMSVYWIIALRARNPVEYALKLTNFADAIFSFGLTQSAFLKQFSDVPTVFYDGAFGILLGIAICTVGIYTLTLPKRRLPDAESDESPRKCRR